MSLHESYPNQNTGAGMGASGTRTGQNQGNTDTFEQARQKTGEVIDQVQDKASETVNQVRDQVSGQLENQKTQVAEGLGSVAQMVRMTGDQLRQNNQGMVAQYTDKLADSMDKFSGYLRERDLGDMLNEVQDFARREPALFLGGAFTLGLLAARFLRSSSPDQGQQSMNYNNGSATRYSGQSGSTYDSSRTGTSGTYRGSSAYTGAQSGTRTNTGYGSSATRTGAMSSGSYGSGAYSGTTSGSNYGGSTRSSAGTGSTNWGSGSPNLGTSGSSNLSGEASDVEQKLRGVELEGSDINTRRSQGNQS